MKAIKKYRFQIVAIVMLVLIGWINVGLKDKLTITSKSCAQGNCNTPSKTSTLNNEKSEIFIQDVIMSEPGRFYRLIIKGAVDRDTTLEILLSNSNTSESMLAGSFQIDGESDFSHEVTFQADKKYNGIILRKKTTLDNADVFVKDFKVSKLNVTSLPEMRSLRPSIVGSISVDKLVSEQTKSDTGFVQLKDNNTIFGQIFRADFPSISAVTFDLDVTKTDNRDGKKYALELRKVNRDGDVFEIQKGTLTKLEFKVNEIESYRQADGKVKFPIYSPLEKDGYYFIGINNKKIEVNDLNYLTLNGTKDSTYPEGTTVLKRGENTFMANGDLYFRISDANLKKFQGRRVLSGTILEDLGRGAGSYTYKNIGNPEAIFDLYSLSQDINFNPDKKVLAGSSAQPESNMEYEFDTVYNFNSFKVNAAQVDSGWDRLRLSYSINRSDWQDIPSDTIKGLQDFNHEIKIPISTNKIYIKVQPDGSQNGIYGMRNFVFEAKLLIK